MKEIEILYEDNHLLVVVKPPNILIQSDKTQDKDLLTILKEYLKVTYNKPGNVYLGLVHRLDRPVGGVCLFAKTSKAAQRLTKQFFNKTITKEYLAIIDAPLIHDGEFFDYLLKDSKTNTVITTTANQGKLAHLTYQVIKHQNYLSLVKINLITGRSHQIRVQFSSRNLPLLNDQRYNSHASPHQQIALWASSLSFEHPTQKKVMTIKSSPPKKAPWTIFERSLYAKEN